jgi:hypothetical protein
MIGIKSQLSKPLARAAAKKIRKWSSQPHIEQQKVFKALMEGVQHTAFGRDHKLTTATTYQEFQAQVPIREYEALRPYVDRILAGEENVLWKGVPKYLAKTSGTTSGAKYIPISKESMPNHINAARNALFCYIAETGNAEFVDGKMIFLQGSPVLDEIAGIKTGRLSGIVAHHVPSYLQKNRLPSLETNCIEDWEEKVDAIVKETADVDMRLIGGIPAWVQMYFERLQANADGELIKDIFKNLQLFIYGGVNYEPYQQRFKQLVGKHVDGIEFYPASEGFIAFQDSQHEKGMLLVVNDGIFYEFIKADDFHSDNPKRINLSAVELGVHYVIILNTNAGLWGYNIGDTIKFVSTDPYRLVVSGRIKHFTSAFGEHVIAEEVELALQVGLMEQNAEVVEFTVAPQVNPPAGELPFHEWLIEFGTPPADLEKFRLTMDKSMRDQNIYYLDLLEGSILQPLKVTVIQKDGFNDFMRSRGKLGGQNKIPRLSNDREYADALAKYQV